MANTYFQFKQFIVHQDKTAMKVCTDACLFGAWAANEMKNEKCKIENVLDIGSGTGLLSLMLAQKTSANIDAVEIDEQAYLQAKENFEASSWNARIKIYHSPIQNFNSSTTQLFDVVISNPPFFEQSLLSADNKKNIAKHAKQLAFDELIDIVLMRLAEDGKFYLLLPCQEFQKFKLLAAEHFLYLNEQVNIKQTEQHTYFRTMGVFSKKQYETAGESSMTIKMHNQYSDEFIALLKDYYLNL